jgi:hypothetical protein
MPGGFPRKNDDRITDSRKMTTAVASDVIRGVLHRAQHAASYVTRYWQNRGLGVTLAPPV